ncbi:hypothetical protein HW555_013258 [Spodoptera exigua]|uniref:Uncharacterized protein n=1 Tax=Spodoptera exigua TaxID=7107 RepID=A0A835G526_SPOEX|nr:hypothetical protein HW555_013258 [Spodoptera exigua]
MKSQIMGFLELIILLAGAPFLAASQSENQTDLVMCDGVIFHDVYYDKELLFTELGRPYNLVMHKFSGMLFFSHTIQNGTQVDFGIRACHLEKKSCREVQGVPGGYAVAYDAGNDDIYFGGHDGIYKYNFLTKSAEFFAEEGKSIWGLFVRRNFYYIEYPTQKLFVYQDDSFVQVAEAINIEVDHFFVSKHIDKVAEIDQAFGMTFDDKDHVIYSDKDTIYRLNPSKYSGLCFNAIINLEDRENGALKKTLKTAVRTRALPEIACNRLKIGDNWYDRDTLWANIGRPYNLNVHRSSNSLFFSYSLPETYADVDFQLAYFNIDTREYQTIAGIRGGCSVAIDQMNDEIYLGGSDGIYKYNMLTKLADFYKEKGKNIWSLFYKKNLFYISYPDQKLHIEYDGKFATVKEFENFEIDYFHFTGKEEL